MSGSSFYIIFSKKLNRYYSGITSSNINERVQKHQLAEYGLDKYTSTADDWELKLVIKCDDMGHARRLELFVKKMKSRRFTEKLINDPLVQDDLSKKFSSLSN